MGLYFEDGTRLVSYRCSAIRDGVEFSPVEMVGEGPTIVMESSGEVKTSIRGTFWVPSEVDWLTDTLRPYMAVDGEEWPLGEFVITSPINHHRSGIRYSELEGYDLGVNVQTGTLDQRITIASGTKYLDAVQEQLVACGIQRVILEPNSDYIRETRADWEIGESRLKVINDLLSEINYRSLWFDSTGAARLTKYQQPSPDLATKTYAAGEMSVIVDGTSSSLDSYGAYNDWIAVVSNPDKSLMTARATNDNPLSALSVQRIGRRTAPIIRLDNIASQSALQEYVDNIKVRGMASQETVTWATANIPHEVGEVVILQHPHLKGVFEETGWEMSLKAGAEMKHTGKRVVYL